MPTYTFQPIKLLDHECCYKFTCLIANSADPEKPTDLDLHCLQKQGIPRFSRTRVKMAITSDKWGTRMQILEYNYGYKNDMICLIGDQLASVAQSDAHPTGDQKVADSIPMRSGNILYWRLIMKYFLQSFSPFC